MRMKLDASEVDDPDQPAGVINDDLIGSAAEGNESVHRPQPLRPIFRRTLLVKGLLFGAIHEAL